MEYIKEESYPILQGRELYLPKQAIKSFNSLFFNKIKLSLREFDKVFNDLRCENFDIIITYRPYHFNEDFGLYLHTEMFCMLVLSILQRTRMSFRDAHTLALDSLLTHGSFHYLIERYATFTGNPSNIQGLQIYPAYKRNVYSKVWGTTECFEETLANAFIFNAHPFWNMTLRSTIEFYISQQRDGYCQAIGIDMEKCEQLYNQLETQIIGYNSAHHLPKLLKFVESNLPFRFFGLPVYLVNDCRRSTDFERIIEVFFPQL